MINITIKEDIFSDCNVKISLPKLWRLHRACIEQLPVRVVYNLEKNKLYINPKIFSIHKNNFYKFTIYKKFGLIELKKYVERELTSASVGHLLKDLHEMIKEYKQSSVK